MNMYTGLNLCFSINDRKFYTRWVTATQPFMEELALWAPLTRRHVQILSVFCNPLSEYSSRSSSVSTVTLLRNGQKRNRGSSPSKGRNIFFKAFRPAVWSSQPLTIRVSKALSSGVRRPDLPADHSPPSNADVMECVKLNTHTHTHTWCLPMPLAERSKVRVCGRSLAGTAGSNPYERHECLSLARTVT
jgi:hypothetical protein